HLGGRADRHAGRDSRHEIGIARLADRHDAPVADTDVGLHDAPVIDDHRVGDDRVERAFRPRGPRRLPHAVADHLAAAELRLLAGDGEIALDADEQVGVGQPDAVADGGAIEVRVLPPRNAQGHDRSHWARRRRACSRLSPWVSALSPNIWRAPASSTRVTRFSSPGSKRTAVPAGMFKRMPKAWGRSKRSARLASKK